MLGWNVGSPEIVATSAEVFPKLPPRRSIGNSKSLIAIITSSSSLQIVCLRLGRFSIGLLHGILLLRIIRVLSLVVVTPVLLPQKRGRPPPPSEGRPYRPLPASTGYRRVDDGAPVTFFGREQPSTLVPARLALKFNWSFQQG